MITIYLLQGVIYLWYLEWSTSRKEDSTPWTWGMRAFHGLLWPLSLGLWIYGFLMAFFDDDEDDNINPNT